MFTVYYHLSSFYTFIANFIWMPRLGLTLAEVEATAESNQLSFVSLVEGEPLKATSKMVWKCRQCGQQLEQRYNNLKQNGAAHHCRAKDKERLSHIRAEAAKRVPVERKSEGGRMVTGDVKRAAAMKVPVERKSEGGRKGTGDVKRAAAMKVPVEKKSEGGRKGTGKKKSDAAKKVPVEKKREGGRNATHEQKSAAGQMGVGEKKSEAGKKAHESTGILHMRMCPPIDRAPIQYGPWRPFYTSADVERWVHNAAVQVYCVLCIYAPYLCVNVHVDKRKKKIGSAGLSSLQL